MLLLDKLLIRSSDVANVLAFFDPFQGSENVSKIAFDQVDSIMKGFIGGIVHYEGRDD